MIKFCRRTLRTCFTHTHTHTLRHTQTNALIYRYTWAWTPSAFSCYIYLILCLLLDRCEFMCFPYDIQTVYFTWDIRFNFYIQILSIYLKITVFWVFHIPYKQVMKLYIYQFIVLIHILISYFIVYTVCIRRISVARHDLHHMYNL